jgi:phosphatidate cytidylyltransferase
VALIDKDYATITPFHKYGVMIAGWSVMLYFTNGYPGIGNTTLHMIGWWMGLAFLFVLPAGEVLLTQRLNYKNIGYSILGLLYISLSWALLTHLRSLFAGSPFPLLSIMPVLMIIGSIWINDTMAYIVGSLIGRNPLSRISPKKTLEGTLGGILLAVTVMGIAGYYFDKSFEWGFFSPSQWMIVALIASVAGTFGDLLESKLKRLADIKDSGHIMPGHGGFLDRFDSLLLATPFVWLYMMWIITG